MTAKSEETIDTLRLDLANAEHLRRQAEHRVAELEGLLKEGKHADLEQLRQQLVEASAARDAETATVNDLRAQLTDLTSRLDDETARADRTAMDAAALRQLNLNLTGVVQVLKQTVAVPAPPAPTPPTRADVQKFTPWYKRRWVLALAGVALVMLITAVNVKLIADMFNNSPASAPALAVVAEQAKPAVPASAPVAPSIQPTNTPKSSCQYASLNACVGEMARRLGVAPSDASIRKYGTYSCQRIGCQ